MPIKMGKKTYKDYGSAVAAKMKEGLSRESAQKYVGAVQAKEEGTSKKKKK